MIQTDQDRHVDVTRRGGHRILTTMDTATGNAIHVRLTRAQAAELAAALTR